MPSDPRYTNPFDEIRNIEAVMLRNRGAEAAVRRFTPTSAALYANYARDYPWMQPGVIRAASQAGYYPNNPDMVRVAATSLAEGVASGRIQSGNRVRQSNMNPGAPDRRLIASDRLPANPNTPVAQEDPFAEYRANGMIDPEGNLIRPAKPVYKGRENGKAVWDYETPEDKAADREFTKLLRLVSEQQGTRKPIPYQFDKEWFNWHPRTGNSETINRRPSSSVQSAIAGAPLNRASSVPVLGEAVRGIQSVVEPAYQAAQPVLRTAGAVANYPIQEFQSAGRNINLAVKRVQTEGVGSLFEPPPDEMKFGGEATDIGIMGEQLLGGEKIDAGSGFFVSPTSEVARERVSREAEAGQIGGHNITWGRWAASAITDPDTIPFDVMSGFVDFGIQIADPTAAGLGEAGRARQAAKLFEAEDILDPHVAAGILGSRGRRPFVDFNTAKKVFDSPIGTKAINDLAATDSAYQIGKKLNNHKLEFKHDPALYDSLAGESDPVAIRAILTDAINTGGVREVADVTGSWGHGLASMVRRRMPRSRLMDKMPGMGVHLSDPVDVVNNVMRSYRNVNAPEEAIEAAVNNISKATTRHGRRNAVIAAFGSGPNSILAHHGIDPDIADEMTRLYQTTFNEMWRGIVDEMGMEVPTWEHILANGEKTYIGGPHALIELIEDFMPLPDARALRSLTKSYPNLIGKLPEESKARVLAELPGAAVDYLLQEVWKPLALMRGAWLVRVLGEGQMRIAADGLDSLFSGHPLEAIGFMMSKKRIPTGIVPGLRDIEPRVPISFMDDPWEEIQEYDNAISKVANWAHRPGAQQTTTHTTPIRKGQHADKEYRHAWGRQLLKFNYDPIYHRWIDSNSLDEMMDWFQNGKGREYVREYQEAYPGNMQTPEQIRKFLDDIDLRFEFLAKGNTDLFDILRSGEFTNAKGVKKSIYRAGTRSAGNPEINPEFTRYLARHMDDAPEVVISRGIQATRGKSDYPTLRKYAVQNFLYGAMSKSENLLARAPVFKQAYAREMADMIQFGTTKARQQAIAKARSLRVPNRTIKHMEHLSSTKAVGKLSMDEMDLVAKGRAMDRTQKLLYSYSERRQIFDITRNFFPFGDAWFEVMSTWGRIVRNTAGKPLRRGQQLIEGSINSGFFAENRFGELAFTYPFMGALNESITGAPVEMEGRVQGLSMFGEVMPGLGPVAQIPAAWFLKDKPELAALEEFLLPFGAPEGEKILSWKTYAPNWLKTGLTLAGIQTADDKRLFENTVSQMADYKASTGEYGNTPAEQSRLWQDARRDAKEIYGIRMIAQFWAPAAPSLDFYVEDKTGTRLSAMALAEEFYRGFDEEGTDYETEVAQFVDKYGENALGALVASSATSVPGFPDSREGQQWIDDNPEIKGKYPFVYALFAPEGEFDIDTYTRQFQGDDRQPLSARQHIALLSDWKNRYWRATLMQKMEDEDGNPVRSYADMNQEQRNAWEDITELIDDEYAPARTGIYEKPQIDDMIKQLEDAGKDEAILATPAGPALERYLGLRTEAQELVDQLKESGAISSQIKGYTKAKALRPIREALRSEGQALIDEYPAFEPLWEFVFSRELARD